MATNHDMSRIAFIPTPETSLIAMSLDGDVIGYARTIAAATETFTILLDDGVHERIQQYAARYAHAKGAGHTNVAAYYQRLAQRVLANREALFVQYAAAFDVPCDQVRSDGQEVA